MLKNALLWIALLAFVLGAHYPLLYSGVVHFEQAAIYVANQSIHSWQDLFRIYMHPQMLYAGDVPFFRPSGHFLIYQLLGPWLGWHNMPGFFSINLIFLAGVGIVMIKLYQLLFPDLKAGAYVAFALYMMHPVLILSHVVALHFDYAYVFFSLLSIYCLLRQEWLGCLLAYFIAITFKEIALATSLVLISYVWLQHKQSKQIYLGLLLSTLAAFLYVHVNDLNGFNIAFLQYKLKTNLSYYFLVLTGTWTNFSTSYWYAQDIFFPIVAKVILWLAYGVLMIALLRHAAPYKKSIVFLLLAMGIYLILPLTLGEHPWHLSLSLVFLSMLMGFAAEVVIKFYLQSIWPTKLTYLIAALIGISTITVLKAHLENKHSDAYFLLLLNHNAIFNAPPIQNQLNAQSIVLVADYKPVGAYFLGAGFYPFINKADLSSKSQNYFLRPQPVYGGLLFRWAYLLPNLSEEIYPFNVEKIHAVPNEVVQRWLANRRHIHCLSYDERGNWHDVTQQFKTNLLQEAKLKGVKLNVME